ncbi:MAG: hypothetical protein ACI81G_001129, partial [Gammaproteobacteria bacterium]
FMILDFKLYLKLYKLMLRKDDKSQPIEKSLGAYLSIYVKS